MTKLPTAGVVIGRFQVPTLHAGHLALLSTVDHRHEKMIVMIGDRKTPATATNPLSYEIRTGMIRELFPNAIFVRLFDCKSDIEWSDKVDEFIRLYSPDGATLYSGRFGFIPHYFGNYPTEELTFGYDDVEATRVRDNLAHTYINTDQFRSGVIHAYQTLTHRTYNTVDVALWRDLPKLQIALGRRINEDEWRLAGGFREPDELLIDTARRELQEEMGIDLEAPPEYVKEYLINDWRIRGAKGVSHSTTLFLARYFAGRVHGGDDLAIAQWYDVDYVLDNLDTLVVTLHRPLVVDAINLIKTKI